LRTQVQNPTLGEFLTENTPVQNFSNFLQPAVTVVESVQIPFSVNPIHASNIHCALSSAASVMDYQYRSTLHTRTPDLPLHLTSESLLPRNVINPAVIASNQHLQFATCTDVSLQPDQSYSLPPALTHQTSAHALTPHLTSVSHLPTWYLLRSFWHCHCCFCSTKFPAYCSFTACRQ